MTYTDPRFLQCGHVYCLQCIHHIMEVDEGCPTCCQATGGYMRPASHLCTPLKVLAYAKQVLNHEVPLEPEELQHHLEDLQCSICLDILTSPRSLQCFHVNCQQCLESLVIQDPAVGHSSLQCPNCRHVTPVPDDGVAGLQSAALHKLAVSLLESLK